jgi:hypothetical protein
LRGFLFSIFSVCPLIPKAQHITDRSRGKASLGLRASLAVTGAVLSGTRALADRANCSEVPEINNIREGNPFFCRIDGLKEG